MASWNPDRALRMSPYGDLHPCFDLLPSYDGHKDSITKTQAFRLLMGSVAAMKYFKDTKLPLPMEMVANNEVLLEAINILEPGAKISWELLPLKIKQIKSKLSHIVPQLFMHLDYIMKVYKEYVYTTIKFINYDLHLNMLKALFSSTKEPTIMKLFGVPEERYLAELMVHQDTIYMKHLDDQWANAYTAAKKAAVAMLEMKGAISTWETMEKFEALVKEENDRKAGVTEEEKRKEQERAKAHRAAAVEVAYQWNSEREHRQIGQLGNAPLPDAVAQAMNNYYATQAQIYLDHNTHAMQMNQVVHVHGSVLSLDTWRGLGQPQNMHGSGQGGLPGQPGS